MSVNNNEIWLKIVEYFTCNLSDRSFEKKDTIFCIINMVSNGNIFNRDLSQEIYLKPWVFWLDNKHDQMEVKKILLKERAQKRLIAAK